MAAYFNLTLDTLGPSGNSVIIAGGAAKTGTQSVSLAIRTSDTSVAGYTMKVYGDIVGAATKEEAEWEEYKTSKEVQLTSGDGVKTVYVIIRDDVWNESTPVSDFIELDTAVAVVTISGPDVSKVSEVSGKNVSEFSFTVNEDFIEYAVMVVPATGSAYTAGTLIGTANGSVNTSGTGAFKKDAVIEVAINASDFKAAKGGSDGVAIVKVFVNDGVAWSL